MAVGTEGATAVVQDDNAFLTKLVLLLLHYCDSSDFSISEQN